MNNGSIAEEANIPHARLAAICRQTADEMDAGTLTEATWRSRWDELCAQARRPGCKPQASEEPEQYTPEYVDGLKAQIKELKADMALVGKYGPGLAGIDALETPAIRTGGMWRQALEVLGDELCDLMDVETPQQDAIARMWYKANALTHLVPLLQALRVRETVRLGEAVGESFVRAHGPSKVASVAQTMADTEAELKIAEQGLASARRQEES